jgi:hypothetical protein
LRPHSSLGNAQITDTHLASTVVAVDEEIIDWLARREKCRRNRRQRAVEDPRPH